MKLLLAIIVGCSSLNAAQIVDFGYFYTNHHEKGYSYYLHGMTLSYEIGEPSGVSALGKTYYSNDDKLFYIKSKNLFKVGIPFGKVLAYPLMGTEQTVHRVCFDEYEEFDLKHSKVAVVGGLGMKAEWQLISATLTAAHLHYIMNHEIYSRGSNYVGTVRPISHAGKLTTSARYKISPSSKIGVSCEWEKAYRHHTQTWIVECNANVEF